MLTFEQIKKLTADLKKERIFNMKTVSNTIENILEIEGVNAKGYGLLPQAPMFDIRLPIQSKSIYAYLVSYTGAGRSVYPKIETILHDLKISKDTYYKYLYPLIKLNYIKVTKAKGFQNKNIYTITNNPIDIKTEIEATDSESHIYMDGINANGYGFIPKLIMCDTRISIKTKALIAFFYSLVQAGTTAFPHRQTILTFLHISKNAYYKALNELILYNYIYIKQRRNKGGKFSVNDYVLNSNPRPQSREIHKDDLKSENLPCPQNKDIPKNGLNTEVSPCPQNKDIHKSGLSTEVLPCPQNKDILKNDRVPESRNTPCPQNKEDNNSTSINSTTILSNLSISCINTDSKSSLIKSVNDLTRIDEFSDNSDFSKMYRKVVKLLIEMLLVKDYAFYNKQAVKTQTLFEYLNDCITEDECLVNDDGCIIKYSLKDLILTVVWHYDICRTKYKIYNPAKYIKSLIYYNIINFEL